MPERRIIPDGWAFFAKREGVDKKEDPENFEWMTSYSDRTAYEDCRQALDQVEGSREWLKTYTSKRNQLPFRCEFGGKIGSLMTMAHSGASFTTLLWFYKNALNNWDEWVRSTKKYNARKAYKEHQIDYGTVTELLYLCEIWAGNNSATVGERYKILGGTKEMSVESLLYQKCTVLGLVKKIPETTEILKGIKRDWDEITQEENRLEEEDRHHSLIGSLEFLYEHPSRWFDTYTGCSLRPGSPQNITLRAMDEMEEKYPGYKNHISKVKTGIATFNARNIREKNTDRGWDEWHRILESFMHEMGIVAGVIE
jgi:hypothetical protein